LEVIFASESFKMTRIVYCSDLILRVEDPDEEIGNVTSWILESTDFKPAFPEGCVLRQEVGAVGKVTVILLAWFALVALTLFYCYFCERRFFPRQRRLMTWSVKSDSGSEHMLLCKKRKKIDWSKW